MGLMIILKITFLKTGVLDPEILCKILKAILWKFGVSDPKILIWMQEHWKQYYENLVRQILRFLIECSKNNQDYILDQVL